MKGYNKFMNKNSSRTLKEWIELVKKELKGNDSDSLIWKTPEGIDIQPLYTEKRFGRALSFRWDTWISTFFKRL